MAQYSIWYNDEIVGTADVQRQGMYYIIRCTCHTGVDHSRRICAQSADKTIDLGVCIPQGTGSALVKRISCKSIDLSTVSFRMADGEKREMCELCADKPFASISRLPYASLCRREGKLFVSFSEDQSNSKPTGQWSEPITSE